MRILAFDACLGAVSAAAGAIVDGRWSATMASAFVPCSSGHAEQLLPMLADVMGRAGLAFADLDRVVVTNGPGGFTGVRVGVAAARALAIGRGTTLVGIDTLEALAAEVRAQTGSDLRDRDLVVAIDARRDMVFLSRFAPDGGRTEPTLLSLADAAAGLTGAVRLCGSAATALAERVGPAAAVEVVATALEPHALRIGLLGADRPATQPLRPLYLRAPDAKVSAAASLPRISP